ncbi:MAG TPA: hypothetical protein VGN90_09390, partial [Pyrinomonadaceae bacterium]|nr:hypothetical protein [Pyrinomonadaceae bacterium]
LVFSQPGTNGRTVAQGSRQGAVRFINNVPDAAALNNALKGFPPGSSLGRFRRITIAGTLAPLDADVNKRLDAIANAVKTNGGTVGGTNSESLLSGGDRNGLAVAGINLTGFDEVIFLDQG